MGLSPVSDPTGASRMADPKLDQYGFPIPEDALDRLEPQRPAPARGAEPPADKRGRGCLFYGCLFTAIGLVLLVVAVVALAYFGLRQVRDAFTAAEPVEIPVVELPEEDLQRLEERFEGFRRAVEPDDAAAADGDAAVEGPDEPAEPAPRELSLSAKEINALIATQPELRGRVFLRVEDGRIGGDLSIPLDDVPMLGGRFFNARADFEVAVEGGVLDVRLADAEVNGDAVPAEILDQLGNENLAEEAADDPEFRRFLQRVESLRVEGDRVILRLRDPQRGSGPSTDPDAEAGGFEDPAPAP